MENLVFSLSPFGKKKLKPESIWFLSMWNTECMPARCWAPWLFCKGEYRLLLKRGRVDLPFFLSCTIWLFNIRRLKKWIRGSWWKWSMPSIPAQSVHRTSLKNWVQLFSAYIKQERQLTPVVPRLLQKIKWEPGDGKSAKLTGQLAWCALQGIARVPVCNNG